MGRPKRTGFNYFPLDISFFEDIKIRKLIRRGYTESISVYMASLCSIFKDGYFLEIDEDFAFFICEKTGVDEERVKQCLDKCVEVGLFDKELYDSGILTSAGIQERYAKICEQTNRVFSMDKYLLIDFVSSEKSMVSSEETQVNSEESMVSYEETQVNSEKSTQSKVKESKEKKSKEKKRKINSLSLSPSLSSGDTFESASAEPTDREREDFLKIFFFKNYKNPESQVEMFVNHYKATGWTRTGGAKVTDRSALAMTWEPKDPSQKDRFPHPFMDFWKELYGKLEKVEAARYGLPLMLRGISGVTSMPGGNIVATVSADLRNYLSRATKLLTVTFLKHYPGKEFLYNVKE